MPAKSRKGYTHFGKEHSRAGADMKLGLVGFALKGACNLDLKLCVDYYGMMNDVEEVKGPGDLSSILGGDDERITPWTFRAFFPSVVKNERRVGVHLYPNARHTFHDPRWERYGPQAAEDTQMETLLFLSQFR